MFRFITLLIFFTFFGCADNVDSFIPHEGRLQILELFDQVAPVPEQVTWKPNIGDQVYQFDNGVIISITENAFMDTKGNPWNADVLIEFINITSSPEAMLYDLRTHTAESDFAPDVLFALDLHDTDKNSIKIRENESIQVYIPRGEDVDHNTDLYLKGENQPANFIIVDDSAMEVGPYTIQTLEGNAITEYGYAMSVAEFGWYSTAVIDNASIKSNICIEVDRQILNSNALVYLLPDSGLGVATMNYNELNDAYCKFSRLVATDRSAQIVVVAKEENKYLYGQIVSSDFDAGTIVVSLQDYTEQEIKEILQMIE